MVGVWFRNMVYTMIDVRFRYMAYTMVSAWFSNVLHHDVWLTQNWFKFFGHKNELSTNLT